VSFAYVPLVEGAQGWVVELDGVWIDGVDMGFVADRVRFTTGTFLMLIPAPHYLSFIQPLINITTCGLFPSQFMDCPCSQAQLTHNLTLVVGKLRLEVPSAAYFYEVRDR